MVIYMIAQQPAEQGVTYYDTETIEKFLKELELLAKTGNTEKINHWIDLGVEQYRSHYASLRAMVSYFLYHRYTHGSNAALPLFLNHPELLPEDRKKLCVLLDILGHEEAVVTLFPSCLLDFPNDLDLYIIQKCYNPEMEIRRKDLEQLLKDHSALLSCEQEMQVRLKLAVTYFILTNLGQDHLRKTFDTVLPLSETARHNALVWSLLAWADSKLGGVALGNYLDQLAVPAVTIFPQATKYILFSILTNQFGIHVDNISQIDIKNVAKFISESHTKESQYLDKIHRLKKHINKGAIRWEDEECYTNDYDIAVWLQYKSQFSSIHEKHNTIHRSQLSKRHITTVISEKKWIQAIINFGSSYAWLENSIAQEHPDIPIYGLDRFEEVSSLNRKEFNSNNLHFISTGDILEYLDTKPLFFNNSIFHHCYVCMFMLPRYIENLYTKLHHAGVKYIVCHEHQAFSCQEKKIYEFSATKQIDSVLHKGHLLLHNYPYLLKQSGFKVISQEIVKTPHPEKDFNSTIFIAEAL